MVGDLFSKLQEAREKIEEAKKNLNKIIVDSSIDNGSITVYANANKVVTNIDISDDFFKKADKEAVEDLMLTAVNRALEEAAQKGEAEMKKVTKGMLPNFPGLI